MTGYLLYEGVASQTYTNTTDVGTNTTATVTGLVPGTTYYFAVSSYDTNGLQSPLSGEISYTVPQTTAGTVATLTLTQSGPNQVQLGGTAPAGYIYDVQTSQNLSNWTKLGSVTATPSNTVQFTDNSATNRFGFYRLRQTSP